LYVAHSSQTAAVCTNYLLVSPYFEKNLQTGMGAIISHTSLGRIISESLGDATYADLVFIMRGGLNFDVREGLAEIGIRPTDHYLASQRKRVKRKGREDDWTIQCERWRKMFEHDDTPRQVNGILGDIVATGTSLEHGLETALDDGDEVVLVPVAHGG